MTSKNYFKTYTYEVNSFSNLQKLEGPLKIEIRGKPQFTFDLTVEQTDYLMRSATAHYDHHCKSYAREGGVIWSWHNSTTNWPGFKITAYFEHLDTCLKILEWPPANKKEGDEIIRKDLNYDFHAALTLANRQYDNWLVST